MSDQVMYRAFFSFQGLSMWHPDSPVNHFFSSMRLSDCGKYLEHTARRMDDSGWEATRHEVNDYWQPTKEAALAAVAPRLRQIGERLIRQANEIEENATRPALAEK